MVFEKNTEIINIKSFDPNLLNIDKTSFKSNDAAIYNTKCITMKSLDSENIDSENPLCLFFTDVDAHIITENDGYKYLTFLSTNKNKNVLRKYTDVWNGIKNHIETINDGKSIKY